jgi:hypothetical protein
VALRLVAGYKGPLELELMMLVPGARTTDDGEDLEMKVTPRPIPKLTVSRRSICHKPLDLSFFS